MRKLIAWLMLMVLMLTAAHGAYAEGPFRMAGYDPADTQHVWTENLFFERMQTITGVELTLEQYYTPAEWAAAKARMFAEGGDMPDALFKAELTPQETVRLYQEGKLIDLRPYLAENAPALWALLSGNETWMEAVTLPDGAIVALPAIDELQFNNAMWINQTWLTQLGMQAPTTADELVAVLRAIRDTDLNGNGKADEVPLTFTTMWDLRFLAHAFGVNANDYYVTMDDSGVVSEVITTPQWRAFLEWLHMLWEEGLLDVNGFNALRSLNGTTDEDAEIVYGVLITSTPVELVPVAALNQYALLMPFTCDGRQVYRDLTGDVVRGTFAITSACKDPAALLRWVDYLYTEEGFILSEAGMADEEFYWNDDGTWLWDSSSETLMNSVLPSATIRSGASMPGYASIPFQQKIDDASTCRIVEELLRLKGVDSMPYPLVYLPEADQQRADEIIFNVGRYAERQMVWFVAGDVPLNDETWQEFCTTVKSLGIDDMVAIWQNAADTLR